MMKVGVRERLELFERDQDLYMRRYGGWFPLPSTEGEESLPQRKWGTC